MGGLVYIFINSTITSDVKPYFQIYSGEPVGLTLINVKISNIAYPVGESFFWADLGYISHTTVFELNIDNLILDSLNFTQTPIFFLGYTKNIIYINNLHLNNMNFERTSIISDFSIADSDVISLN